MTTLFNYITELICLHDCVIVPGLGGFVANYKPADIDIEKGLFTPPNKEIGFNRKLQHNDGLLLQHIVQKSKKSYSEASELVSDFVSHVNDQINENKVCPFGEIGELTKDTEGNYLFTPNAKGAFLADAFGLSAFHIAVPDHIKQIQQKETPIRHFISRATIHKGIAAGVGLFVGLFLFTTDIENPQKISFGSLNNIIELPSATQLPELVEESQESTNNIEDSEILPEADKTEKKLFHIVVASFPDTYSAEKQKEKLIAEGFAEAQVFSSPGKNRVTIEHFPSKEDAVVSLEKYRQTKRFRSAWVLKDNQ